MRKKIVISIAVVSLLLIGIMATSVFASNSMLAKNTDNAKELVAAAKSDTPRRNGPVRERSQNSIIAEEGVKLPEIDVEELEGMVPETYDETDARISTQRVRFLLYTHDGKHIMWGYVGNGFFVGTDNLGKRCWGIYGNGVFAGFYDGGFFWGRYRNGHWKAEGLFGENYTHGKYILFPTIDLEPSITATVP